jgi:hypothetical protein
VERGASKSRRKCGPCSIPEAKKRVFQDSANQIDHYSSLVRQRITKVQAEQKGTERGFGVSCPEYPSSYILCKLSSLIPKVVKSRPSL